MKLPEVAAELRELAEQSGLERLSELADEISRRRNGARGPRVSIKMTPEVAKEIRECHEAYPDLTQMEIAQMIGVAQGRVSEVLYGKRV